MIEPALSRVCVVGSINMDLVIRVPRLPAGGETVMGGSYRTYPGGKGANQAVAAARMGAAVTFVGAVGDDPHGTKVLAALEGEKLDLRHLRVREGETTGLGLITVADGGENMIVVSPGANATVKPEDVLAAADAITSADVLLLQLEIPNSAIFESVRLAREAGVCVMLNAAPARSLPPDLLKLVDVLVVNRGEAAVLLGLDPSMDPGRMTLRLPELGPPTIILTLGSQGSILSHRGRPRRVPTPSVNAVDAVAAGDAFCGALAASWKPVHEAGKARSSDEFKLVEPAILAASAAGALAATKPGAIPSLPSREEVLALAASLKFGT
jgi:ribokinase